ncbi:MAG: hypothetical protein F2839_06925 [Actinobacteria bacterium]|uniref:Unannotated protein n=1 Tax=freshwater metagenome TaxID=449393 RepID=A0A6J5ZS78_9ZZZZ|nr:hypothetical protein [Actinomycetota bacterium]
MSESNSDLKPDKYAELYLAWSSFDEKPFDKWIIDVSETYFRSGVGLKIASQVLDIQPAELQAALNLATLDEQELELLATLNPPKTTWFTFAAATTEEIQLALEALREMHVGQSPFSIVEAAIREIKGPTTMERIAGLSADAFGHAAKKAVGYKLLNDKHIKALKGWQTRVRTGRPLTPPQMKYAESLFAELVTNGAIARQSKDGDEDICNEILDALGVD